MIIIAFVFVSALFVAVYWQVQQRKARQAFALGCEEAPRIPLQGILGIGNLRNHLRARIDCRWPEFLIDALDSAGKHVHTACHRAIGQDFFYTRDVENIKAILFADSDDYKLGGCRGSNMSKALGEGLFTVEHDVWQYHRSSARPYFSRARIESHLQMLDTLVQGVLASMQLDQDGWTQSLDLQQTFLDLMLDATIWHFLGETASIGPSAISTSAAQHCPSISSLATSLDMVTSYVARRTVLGGVYWIKQSLAFRRHRRNICQFMDSQYDARKGSEEGQVKGSKSQSTSDSWTELEQRSDWKNRIQPFLATGRHGSGPFVALLLFYLAKNPSIYQRLQEDILSTFGKEGEITASQLEDCEFLNHCVSEALRLGSLAPAIIRSAKKDTRLPTGGGPDMTSPILIPKGSPILLCIHALHLRPDIWGDDVRSFNPDRWNSYRFDWGFLPFSKGRRQCIAQHLVVNQAKMIVIRFLQRFDIAEFANKDCSVKHQTEISTRFVFDSPIRFRCGGKSGAVAEMSLE